ncbi:MAG TPA: CoA transferase [Acidimicrobiales bacterium]|nr:CoA transferase [Acidimicrobiales bacterium]
MRVVDLTSVVMGPLATQILGDLGAEVMTIEPANGETNRVMGAAPHPELSGVSLNLLRNKRNVKLDLKSKAGRDAFLKIAATCDVMVTNLRPGPLTRLGLTYADVRQVREDIVYCRAHGFPSDGPRADDPAYDDIIQAATGVADAFTRTTGEPSLVPTIFADKVSGLTVTYAVLAALYHRSVSGEGQEIEVPMVDAATAFMLVEHGAGAVPRPPLAPAGYPRILTGERRPQRTLDGWVSVLPYSKGHWDTLFEIGGRTELVGDERMATGRARLANSAFLYRQLADILASRSTGYWLEFCAEHSIPASPVASLDDLVDALPEAEHPVTGTYKVVPPPARFSRTPASGTRRPAPLVGQHTEEVLAEVGMTAEEIAEVRGQTGHRP